MQFLRLTDVTKRDQAGHHSAGAHAETVLKPREARASDSEHVGVGVDSLVDFYDAHAPCAYGLAVRLLAGDRALAEDIVVETFVVLWRSLPLAGVEGNRDLEYVLLGQIRKRCLDALRGRPNATGIREAG